VTDPEQLKISDRAKRYGVPIYGTAKAPVSFKGIPANWLLDRNGVIVERTGYQKPHVLLENLAELLAK
jgi:hypothetical protein